MKSSSVRTPKSRRSRVHRNSSFNSVVSPSAKAMATKEMRQQSVDDLVIERYFESKEETEDSPPEMQWNRVHSRIPDRCQLNDIVAQRSTSHKVPASFMS